MRLLLIFLLLAGRCFLYAHPSWGIAVVPSGTVYFVDVTHHGLGTLWEWSPDGRLRARLTEIHAHSLQLNTDGSLWIAEQQWITGEIEGEGHNYLYRFRPEGRIDTLLFTDDWDQFFGAAFGVDSQGRVYFLMDGKIWRRTLEGKAEDLVDFPFVRLTNLYLDPDNQLWITDKAYRGGTLFRWTEAAGLEPWATGLLPEKPVNPVFEEERHQLLLGISRDEQGNLYVADNAARRIQRVNADREISVFYESQPPWHPAGVAFHKGVTYVLESGWDHGMIGPRLLRVDQEGDITELVNVDTYRPGRSAVPTPEEGPSPNRRSGLWIGGVLLVAVLAVLGFRLL